MTENHKTIRFETRSRNHKLMKRLCYLLFQYKSYTKLFSYFFGICLQEKKTVLNFFIK